MQYETRNTVKCLIHILVTALFTGGCADQIPNLKPSSKKQTFHETVGWKAENFFADTDIVRLCEAIQSKDLAVMKQLIESGVNINTTGKGGMTPLLWAFVDDESERFELLLEHGADPNVKITSRLNAPNAFDIGDSVTTVSAASYFSRPYEAVLKHGGDPSIKGSRDNPLLHILIRAPISLAEKKRRIKLALEHGADINQTDEMGTVASSAVGYGQQWELVLWLLEMGADPNYYRPKGCSKLVDNVIAHEDRITPGREAAYRKLLDWLKADGQDVAKARKDYKSLTAHRNPHARKTHIQGQIYLQVKDGLRPDPKLGKEACEAWYANRRESKRTEVEPHAK